MTPLVQQFSRAFRAAPIATKLLAIVIFCSLLSLGLISFTSTVRDYFTLADRKLDQLESMAEILANNTVAPLRFDDPDAAAENLAALHSEPNVSCAVIFDKSGQVFAEYHRDPDCPLAAPPKKTGSTATLADFTYTHNIDLPGETLGTITLVSDRGDFWISLAISLVLNGVFLICGLVASILLARRLIPVLTVPVEDLANIAQRVSKESNYKLRARKHHDDEIGQLVESVNFMLRSVRQRDDAINETNRNLEQLVADRTEKLVQAREKAESALDAKSEFLARISHELRTPMNAIIGMTSVIKTDGLDSTRARQLEVVQKSATNLLSLINDILDYSKIEANRLELEHLPFDLVACVEEALEIAAAAAPFPNVIAVSSLDPSLPTRIKGDVTRIRQILINLLSNAFKFTKAGSVRIEVNFVAHDRQHSDRIEFRITDTGIGIPAERLPFIFDSFTQVDTSIARRFGGTGLGLAISQHLAIAMGGKLHAESEYGAGSSFSLLIPLNRVEGAKTSLGKPLNLDSKPRIHLEKLPVELKHAFRRSLESWGCILDLDPENNHDVHIASALADSEPEAIAAAQAIEDHKNLFVVCHAVHANVIKKCRNALVLTLPVRQRDLRNAIINIAQNDASPELPNLNPFADYPVEDWKQLKILLAEDNELSQTVFLHHMELMGIEIDAVSNGVTTVESALRKDYDLIFMDIRMPVMDGIEAAQKIRSKKAADKQPWIIGFTANHDQNALLEIERAGMNDYLAKPAKATDIADSINRFMFQRRQSLEELTGDLES